MILCESMARKLTRQQKASVVAQMRQARGIAGLTQQELADELGIHRSVMNMLERGERRFSARVMLDYVDALSAHDVNSREIPTLDDLAALP